MKLIRFACTLYTGFMVLLLLFPPWSNQGKLFANQLDPAYSSLGNHWRFRLPYYWGYQEHYCTDSNAQCGGESVWVPNRRAIVDSRMLKYEAVLGFFSSLFIALIVDWIGRHVFGATSRFKALVSHVARRFVSQSTK